MSVYINTVVLYVRIKAKISEWTVDSQWFNILLLLAFWRKLFVCWWQHSAQRNCSQVGNLEGSLARQEVMLQSYAEASQPVWASLLLWGAEQDSLLHRCLQQSWCRGPRPWSGRGASHGEWHTTGWVAVTLCFEHSNASGEDARQRLVGMNWYYISASSVFRGLVNKDNEFYLEL